MPRNENPQVATRLILVVVVRELLAKRVLALDDAIARVLVIGEDHAAVFARKLVRLVDAPLVNSAALRAAVAVGAVAETDEGPVRDERQHFLFAHGHDTLDRPLVSRCLVRLEAVFEHRVLQVHCLPRGHRGRAQGQQQRQGDHDAAAFRQGWLTHAFAPCRFCRACTNPNAFARHRRPPDACTGGSARDSVVRWAWEVKGNGLAPANSAFLEC